jgi:hypothetical protein
MPDVLLQGQAALQSCFPSDVVVPIQTRWASSQATQLARLGFVSGAVSVAVENDPEDVARVRRALDGAGLQAIRILVEANMDPALLAAWQVVQEYADGYLIGKVLNTAGSNGLQLDYQLVEWEEGGCLHPVPGGHGASVLFRRRERGAFSGDVVQSQSETPPQGAFPLLVPVMQQGARSSGSPSLAELQVLSRSQIQMLPDQVLRWQDPESYPVLVQIAPGVALAESVPVSGPQDAAVEAEDTLAAVLNDLDDSADFGLVSQAFEGVIKDRLAQAGAEADAELADEASSSTVTAMVEPIAPRFESPEQPDESKVLVDPMQPVAPVPVEMAEKAIASSPLPDAAAVSFGTQTLKASSLEAAAAQLKKARGGGSSAPSPAPAAQDATTKASGDGLADAVAALKKVKTGGAESASQSVQTFESSKEQPAESSASKPASALSDAAARLRALRGG